MLRIPIPHYNQSGQQLLPGAASQYRNPNVSLEAARLAPSAVNRQPWGFDVQDDGITVFVRTMGPEFNVSKRLDCGIAMLHLEVAAVDSGCKGEWEFLPSPQVAKFRIRPSGVLLELTLGGK